MAGTFIHRLTVDACVDVTYLSFFSAHIPIRSFLFAFSNQFISIFLLPARDGYGFNTTQHCNCVVFRIDDIPYDDPGVYDENSRINIDIAIMNVFAFEKSRMYHLLW